MTAAVVAFLTWAAVAAAAVFWGLRLFVPGAPTPEAGIAASRASTLAPADLTRLLGVGSPTSDAGRAAAAPADARFKLLGVAALQDNGAASRSLALLSIDGKPARSFRVGAVVDGDWVLQQVDARSVSIGPPGGAPALTLSLPPLPVAARAGVPVPAAATAAPGPATSAGGGTVATPPTGSAAAGPGNVPASEQDMPTEGRVPNPEPGVLRRPGPLNR
jgi:general secretion pathway protein C